MRRDRSACRLCGLSLLTIPLGVLSPPTASARSVEAFRKQVEADWLLRERYRASRVSPGAASRAMTTRIDAAGACDGVIDGRWGFHTNLAQDPWWQVDLGAPQQVGRVVIWNRTDAVAERAKRLTVLLSDDGKTWRVVYRHEGDTFYGYPDQKPLTVRSGGVRP